MLTYAHANQPWNSTLPTLLLLDKCKTQKDLNQIHARIITNGLIKNKSIRKQIIITFSSSSQIQFAHYFFSQFHYKFDLFLWNSIIKSFSHGHNPKHAISLFSLMLINSVCPDKFSFSLVLKACSRLSSYKDGLQIHCLIGKSELRYDVFLQNSLICFYCRCGFVELARRVFDRMPERDSVSWNSIIDGYVKNGNINAAHELFGLMNSKDKNLITWNSMISGYVQSVEGLEIARAMFDQMVERDLVSWNSMIDGYVKHGKLEAALYLFDRMTVRDVVTWANLIKGYAKIGRVNIARRLFDNMNERDVIIWNVMMAGYVENGHCLEALKLFHKMQSEGNLAPDHATLVTALSAAAEVGRINEGLLIHGYIERNKLPLDGNLGVALIDMYSKCGSIKSAMWVFKNLKRRSVDHWNAIIVGLAIHGLGELALGLFFEMGMLSFKPDDITFIGILNACSHSGLVKEGLLCFELMERVYNVKPKVQHYGCMVDILGRAGYLEEARKVIEEMPIEANDVVWRALLSACKNHLNFDIGQQAAKHLIELGSFDSSSYVLLSNLYAGVGLWGDVRKVRMMMKEREVRKIPGCSWIELNGVVHEFVVGDKPHPEAKEIYFMLDKMCAFKL
ncbi:pentatricopeptide repeat (PPR) superfamily protein [Tasmannia lanceolata]|uniref:pentatricopeptide repeat (PPR) superfamily protein n=1 Tax=Tasmannia lanceolata TaxID=3420 RepID=UPI004063EE93